MMREIHVPTPQRAVGIRCRKPVPGTPLPAALGFALLACAVTAAAPARAAQPLGCLIEPNRVVELGSPVIGVLEQVHVDRGANVRMGQVVATLKADVERASADVAKSRAQAEADVQAAIANRDFNKQRLTRGEGLVQKNFISNQAMDQIRAETDVSEQRLAQAREQKRTWDREYDMARAQLAQRSLVSPLTGVVVDRYLNPGERVEDRAVMKLATLNPLRVEVFMPAAAYREVQTGMNAKVYPDLPGAGEHNAKVILVDRIIDPASNTFRVRLELPNPGNALPAGVRCKVAIGDQVVEAGGDPSKTVVPSSLAPVKPAQPANPANSTKPVQPASPGSAPPAPAAPAPAAAPKVSAAPESVDRGVLQALEAWRKSWTSRDFASYLSAYAPDFRGDAPSRADWLKERETRIRKASEIDIRISDTRVRQLDEWRARVDFRQSYRSINFSDDTLKSLLMIMEQGRWLIREERTGH